METGIIPFAEIKQMASVLGRGRMFGKSEEELLPLMLIAQAEHKHPAIAAQEYDIIQGRPAINARSALARFQSSGGKIQWLKRTDTEASATFSHPQGGELTVTWTIQRAQTAGLTGKDNWKKYPAQMLSSRVVAEGVRAVFPACLSGLYTVEEVQDFNDKPFSNPQPQAEASADQPATIHAEDQHTMFVDNVPLGDEVDKEECKKLIAELGFSSKMRNDMFLSFGGHVEGEGKNRTWEGVNWTELRSYLEHYNDNRSEASEPVESSES